MKNLFETKTEDIQISKYYYGLFDVNNLFWIAFLSSELKNFKVYNNQVLFSGAILLFLELIDKFIDKHLYSDGEFYFLFDNPNSKFNARKQIDFNYKHTRDKTSVPKGFYESLNFCEQLLFYKADNYKLCRCSGLEADDLTYPILKQIKPDRYKSALVFSNDLDWARNIDIFTHWNNWKEVIKAEGFFKRFGFYPSSEKIKMYKSIKGDASDNISSAFSISDKDLLGLLNSYESLQDLMKSPPESLKQKILLSKDKLQRNYKLVDFIYTEFDTDSFIMNSQKNSERYYALLRILSDQKHLF